jgi:hypothetical protein
MNNDQLHKDAVKYLQQRQRSGTETTAKDVDKSYNQRRREATANLRRILKQIWDCLQNGESVGGYTSKEDWASHQSVTIRQIQRIIEGPKSQRHDVALKVGMTVTLTGQLSCDGIKVVLTQALIDLLVPVVTKPTKSKKVKPTTILHAKATGWHADRFKASCGAGLVYSTGSANNVGTGKSVTCPQCLEKRAAKSAKSAETRTTNKKATRPTHTAVPADPTQLCAGEPMCGVHSPNTVFADEAVATCKRCQKLKSGYDAPEDLAASKTNLKFPKKSIDSLYRRYFLSRGGTERGGQRKITADQWRAEFAKLEASHGGCEYGRDLFEGARQRMESSIKRTETLIGKIDISEDGVLN